MFVYAPKEQSEMPLCLQISTGDHNPLLCCKSLLHAQLSGQNPPTVIDVRGEEAFRAGHIEGAKLIPADDIGQSLAQIPKGRPVVTY